MCLPWLTWLSYIKRYLTGLYCSTHAEGSYTADTRAICFLRFGFLSRSLSLLKCPVRKVNLLTPTSDAEGKNVHSQVLEDPGIAMTNTNEREENTTVKRHQPEGISSKPSPSSSPRTQGLRVNEYTRPHALIRSA